MANGSESAERTVGQIGSICRMELSWLLTDESGNRVAELVVNDP